MKLGYVGVGHIGGPIAAALAAHHRVGAFDLSRAALDGVASRGVAVHGSLADLARGSDVVFLCLARFDQVQAVLDTSSELVVNLAPGAMIVDQSTSEPREFARIAARLADRDITLVDAPVSGGPKGVLAGTALFLVGGPQAAADRVCGILRSISSRVLHTGPAGSAMMTKVANNYLAAVQGAATLYAVAMAARFGCDPVVTAEALQQGSGANAYIPRFLKPHVLTGEHDLGATISVMHKDVLLAGEIARDLDIALFANADLADLIHDCVSHYGAQTPYSALALEVSDKAGVAIGKSAGRSLAPDTDA